MANTFKQQIDKFNKTVSDLTARGYKPLFTYIPNSKSEKIMNSAVADMEGSFGKVPRLGKEIQVCRYRTPVMVSGCGSEDRGYIKWGEDNQLPVIISKYAKALPYTATGLRYLTDLMSGNGLEFLYKYTEIVNGAPVERSIPYEQAGVMLINKIANLRKKLKEEQNPAPTPDFNGNPVENNFSSGGKNMEGVIEPVSYRVKAAPAEPKVNPYKSHDYADYGTTQYELDKAIADMQIWEETNDWLQEFKRNSDIASLPQQWAADDVYYNLSFVRLVLEQGTQGKWGETSSVGKVQKLDTRPRIIGIEYQPAQCSRFEEMDDNLHINYIYYAERWRYEGTIKDQARDICAYKCIEPHTRWRDLTNIVLDNQRTSPSQRPTVCAPICVSKTDSPYYDTVSWWSIFSSMLYNLAVNLITDTATARRNSTMWSKIIYIDVNWFDRYATQCKCDTDEQREALRQQLVEEIKSNLNNKDNNGKYAVGDKIQSADEKKSVYSFEIVDIPAPSSKANLDDLESVTSCIFFALGIHPALVGAVPGKTQTSSSGTQQRELTLLKQCQLSPRQRLFLSVFDFIRDWNALDSHLSAGISQYVLSTLDASKTGLVEQSL